MCFVFRCRFICTLKHTTLRKGVCGTRIPGYVQQHILNFINAIFVKCMSLQEPHICITQCIEVILISGALHGTCARCGYDQDVLHRKQLNYVDLSVTPFRKITFY